MHTHTPSPAACKLCMQGMQGSFSMRVATCMSMFLTSVNLVYRNAVRTHSLAFLLPPPPSAPLPPTPSASVSHSMTSGSLAMAVLNMSDIRAGSVVYRPLTARHTQQHKQASDVPRSAIANLCCRTTLQSRGIPPHSLHALHSNAKKRAQAVFC